MTLKKTTMTKKYSIKKLSDKNNIRNLFLNEFKIQRIIAATLNIDIVEVSNFIKEEGLKEKRYLRIVEELNKLKYLSVYESCNQLGFSIDMYHRLKKKYPKLLIGRTHRKKIKKEPIEEQEEHIITLQQPPSPPAILFATTKTFKMENFFQCSPR